MVEWEISIRFGGSQVLPMMRAGREFKIREYQPVRRTP